MGSRSTAHEPDEATTRPRPTSLRPSERNLPALRKIIDAFLERGELPHANLVSHEFGQRSIRELSCLGLARQRYGRLCPTRNGLRRASRLDALHLPTALYRALQSANCDGVSTQWSLENVHTMFGHDERSTRIAMFLLDGAPWVQSLPCGDGRPVLYVTDRDELAAADPRVLEGVQAEPSAVESGDALCLRYGDGERDFPELVADRAALAGVVLDGIRVDRGSMVGADLRGASLRGARLGAFPVPRCRGGLYGFALADADLARADLCGADLRAVDLRGASLEGARLDETTAIPIDALLSATWSVVYRAGVAHRRDDRWIDDDVQPHEEEFRFLRDVATDTWAISYRGTLVASVPNSLGVMIAALLVANPGVQIHALDLAGLLERSPFRAEPLDKLPYESADVPRLLGERGMSALRDLSAVESQRVRACLRACDRLVDSRAGAELRQELETALRKRNVQLHRIEQAKKTVDRVRRAYERARDGALGAPALAPLVQGIRCGEFACYSGKPR